MFRHAIPIGRIFGISIDLDYSWFLIVGLMSWMLAVSYYPVEFPNWSTTEYWLMGCVTAVMLFVSVLIHELGHAVVAKRYGIPVPRITLFLFGGVSQIATEPTSATSEFWIAIIGPLVSLALAAMFWELGPSLAFSPQLFALVKYLALLNLLLAVFNLIPGFPLDGGRVLRAIVWRITGKQQRATVIAAATGRFFGFLLIFIGVWQALRGSVISGMWTAFIGWYLESAAGSQLELGSMKGLIGDHKVVDAMNRDFPRISGDMTVEGIVDNLILREGRSAFVVSGPGDAAGIVTLKEIQTVSRAAWPVTKASQVMIPFQRLAATSPDSPLWAALEKMGRDGVNQLPVTEGNGVVGMLSREDIVHYLGLLRTFAP
jgi:Zn-dependent protease/CBS domain-containing protein